MDLGLRRIYAAGPREAFLRVAGRLTGQVLEVGCGTGVLFDDYPPEARVIAVEPDIDFLPVAQRRAERAAANITVVASDVGQLSFVANAFDAVVVQLVLCCVPDPQRGLGEIFRAVRPGGLLYFYEHVASSGRWYRFVQNVTAPLWYRISEGCHWNRDTAALVRSMPVSIESEERSTLRRGLMPSLPIVRIVATRR